MVAKAFGGVGAAARTGRAAGTTGAVTWAGGGAGAATVCGDTLTVAGAAPASAEGEAPEG